MGGRVGGQVLGGVVEEDARVGTAAHLLPMSVPAPPLRPAPPCCTSLPTRPPSPTPLQASRRPRPSAGGCWRRCWPARPACSRRASGPPSSSSCARHCRGAWPPPRWRWRRASRAWPTATTCLSMTREAVGGTRAVAMGSSTGCVTFLGLLFVAWARMRVLLPPPGACPPCPCPPAPTWPRARAAGLGDRPLPLPHLLPTYCTCTCAAAAAAAAGRRVPGVGGLFQRRLLRRQWGAALHAVHAAGVAQLRGPAT